MAEVRVMLEGELRWVQASGSGSTWATASAPQSGIFGYVQSFGHTSASRIVAPAERGRPNHWKQVGFDTIKVNAQCLWTGFHLSAASGSGASVPMLHLEFRASAAETPTTGRYYQFHGVPVNSLQFTENAEGDTMAYTFEALAMNGATGSGYLS